MLCLKSESDREFRVCMARTKGWAARWGLYLGRRYFIHERGPEQDHMDHYCCSIQPHTTWPGIVKYDVWCWVVGSYILTGSPTTQVYYPLHSTHLFLAPTVLCVAPLSLIVPNRPYHVGPRHTHNRWQGSPHYLQRRLGTNRSLWTFPLQVHSDVQQKHWYGDGKRHSGARVLWYDKIMASLCMASTCLYHLFRCRQRSFNVHLPPTRPRAPTTCNIHCR